MCNCIYCHLRTRRKYLLHSEQQQLASGGATSAPTRPPPPQLLRSIFQFSFSAPRSINHFLVLPGSASSASVVSCQSLRSGCPGSRNPRLAGKNARLCFETDFLVLQSGDKLSVNRCMWLLSSRESEAIYSSGLFLPISCCSTGKRKKLLSFHLINTRTGENVTVSHCRQSLLPSVEKRRS